MADRLTIWRSGFFTSMEMSKMSLAVWLEKLVDAWEILGNLDPEIVSDLFTGIRELHAAATLEEQVDAALKVAVLATELTPTGADDQVIDVLQRFVDQPWFDWILGHIEELLMNDEPAHTTMPMSAPEEFISGEFLWSAVFPAINILLAIIRTFGRRNLMRR